jgi:hypothetical protein
MRAAEFWTQRVLMMGKHVGSAEIASDPMPPNFADPYVMPRHGYSVLVVRRLPGLFPLFLVNALL